MKICMIGAGMIAKKGRAVSGAHTNNIATLGEELVKKGHEVHIVSSYFPLYSLSIDREVSLPWARIHPIKVKGRYSTMAYNLGFTLRVIVKVKELHRREKFNVIHGHSGDPGLALVTGICGLVSSIPSVHTLYSPAKRANTSFPASLFKGFCLRRPDKVVAISENVRNSLCGLMPNTRITVIPPAVGSSFFNLDDEAWNVTDNTQSDETSTLLFLGDVSRTKGAETVIKALARVVEELPKVRLIMGLDPSKEEYQLETRKLRAELEREIKSYSLAGNVTLLGLINNVPQVMRSSDIFITPFLSTDGPADYPLSLLEAMAMAKPVIATRVGGIPEVIKDGENGILVEPGDADSLAKAVVSLLKDKEKREMMGQKGHRFAESHFSAERIAKMTEEVYKELTVSATLKTA